MGKSLSSVVYLCKCNSCTVGTHYLIWRYYTTDLKWIIYGVVIIYHKCNNFMDLWVKLDPIQMLVSTTCLANTKVYKSKVFNSDSCLHRVLIFVNISLQDKKWATAPGAPPHTQYTTGLVLIWASSCFTSFCWRMKSSIQHFFHWPSWKGISGVYFWHCKTNRPLLQQLL